MGSFRWTTTVLAWEDPETVAGFWADLLGGEPLRISDDFLAVRHGTCWIAAQRTRDVAAATWPGGERPVQMHLDISVDDLHAAVDRAVELGAREEAEQPAPDWWRVLRAPGGHVFCLSQHIRDYLPLEDG